MRTADLKRVEMKAQFDYLISRVNGINIPITMIEGLKNGTRKLRLRHGCFKFYEGTYSGSGRGI